MPLSPRALRPPLAWRWLLVIAVCLAAAAGAVALVLSLGRPTAGGVAGPTATGSRPVANEDEPLTTPPPPAQVTIRTLAGGAVMADEAGFTLYAFSADRPFTSRCNGDCARRWIPLVSQGGKPQAGAGTTPAQIGSMRRADGSYQVTYNGWPLYHFVGDTKPGGQDGAGRTEFGGLWSAVPPRAKPS